MILPTNSSDFKIVFTSDKFLESELVKHDLESNEIECFVVNRIDSNYPIFGKYFIYVHFEVYEVAKVIVENSKAKND